MNLQRGEGQRFCCFRQDYFSERIARNGVQGFTPSSKNVCTGNGVLSLSYLAHQLANPFKIDYILTVMVLNPCGTACNYCLCHAGDIQVNVFGWTLKKMPQLIQVEQLFLMLLICPPF
jgi:hypothetical protein